METTRHFVATVYVVHDSELLLHEHPRLGMWLPPGGHLGRDELPREAASREVREETGLDIDIVDPPGTSEIESPTASELPGPRRLMLEDIDIDPDDGSVYHQHIDCIYYASASSRELDPATDELDAGEWEWFSAEELRRLDAFESDVVELGVRAIEAVEEKRR